MQGLYCVYLQRVRRYNKTEACPNRRRHAACVDKAVIVCVDADVYLRVCIYIYTHIFVIYVCKYIYIYIYVRVCVCVFPK